MPTFSVTHTYERTEEDIRRIAEDSDHPLESPYRQACIKWVADHPLLHPDDFKIGTVFTHTTSTATDGTAEYVKLADGKYLRTRNDGVREVRTRSAAFWRLQGITVVFKP